MEPGFISKPCDVEDPRRTVR